MSIQPIAVIAVLVLNFGIAVAVLLHKPRTFTNTAFFIFVCGSVTLGLGMIFLFATHNFIFDKVVLYGGHTAVLGLVLLSKTYPGGDMPKKKFWILLIPLAVVYLVTPFNVFIKGVTVNPDGSVAPINGPAIPFFVLMVAGYLIFSAVSFIKKYLKLSGLARIRMQYLFLGVTIFMSSIFIFSVLLPAFNFPQLNLLGPASSILFVGFVGYAIVRHQLMDIKIIIQKSIIYVLLFGILVSLYFGAMPLLAIVFVNSTSTAVLIAVVLSLVAGALAIPIIERYFRRRVEEKTAHIKEMWQEQKRMMVDISHGLQTPLTVLKSELEALKNKSKSENLSVLDKSVDDMSKFIYDFLNLSRLETAQENFAKEPVNLSLLLSELAEYLNVLAEEKDISLSTKIEPNIFVIGEKGRLGELITNLLSNSVKYMSKDRERKIEIALKKNNGSVKLSVSDTGIGISSEDLPNIFERFYRVKNLVGAKGMGLGLAICKKIVEKHNGTIDVASELGKGTTFTVRF